MHGSTGHDWSVCVRYMMLVKCTHTPSYPPMRLPAPNWKKPVNTWCYLPDLCALLSLQLSVRFTKLRFAVFFGRTFQRLPLFLCCLAAGVHAEPTGKTGEVTGADDSACCYSTYICCTCFLLGKQKMEVCCLNQSSKPLTAACQTPSIFVFQDKSLDTAIHGVNAYQGTCIHFDNFNCLLN